MPTVPLGSVPVVMLKPAGLIVIVTGPEPELGGLLESVIPTVIVVLPGVVGVPLTTQFAPSVSPAGSVPVVIAQVYGPVPPLPPMFPL